MEKELVSIIITCYNQENLIDRAISSVIKQTYPHWECIIVDDGSSDNSIKKIQQYCQIDNRISIIQQENQGVSAARNSGFKKAKGEFIQFLDGDDWLHHSKLERQIVYFKNNPDVKVNYVKHDYFIASENKHRIFNFEILEERPIKQFIYNWHASVAIPPHALLYYRNIWEKDELPFPEDYNKREEDWIFNIITALKDIKYSYIDEILCTYYIGKDNFTTSLLNSCVNTIEAAKYIMNLLPENEQDKFWDYIVRKTFNRYHDCKKNEVLHASKNWWIGYILTKPFFLITKAVQRFFKNATN